MLHNPESLNLSLGSAGKRRQDCAGASLTAGSARRSIAGASLTASSARRNSSGASSAGAGTAGSETKRKNSKTSDMSESVSSSLSEVLFFLSERPRQSATRTKRGHCSAARCAVRKHRPPRVAWCEGIEKEPPHIRAAALLSFLMCLSVIIRSDRRWRRTVVRIRLIRSS